VVVGGVHETINGGGGADVIEVTGVTIGATINGGAGASELELTTGGTAVMGANITSIHKVVLKHAATFTANCLGGLTVVGSANADTLIAGGTQQTLTGEAGADTLVGWSGGGGTFLDKSANLNGDTLQNFTAPGDVIDLTDMSAKNVIVAFAAGVLTVTSGKTKAAIKLTGTFAATDFHAMSDGAKGTDITYTAPAGPSAAGFAQTLASFAPRSDDAASTPLASPASSAPLLATPIANRPV